MVTDGVRVVAAAFLMPRADIFSRCLGYATIWSLPAPARHHHVVVHARAHGVRLHIDGEYQGFLLSDGTFARRVPALRIAQSAGQLTREPTSPARGLLSEDVW